MISRNVQHSIEKFSHSLKKSSPLFKKTRSGELSKTHIEYYLNSIRFLIEHTPIHLRLALDESRRLGLLKLAQYFEHKIGEEEGHDAWAREDLQKIAQSHNTTSSDCISPRIRSLVSTIESTIKQDPQFYLGYIFLSEYLTVLIAPEWLEALEANCGIPTAHMTVVSNHVELDKEHVAENVREIDLLVAPEHEHAMNEYLTQFMGLVEDFYSDVASFRPAS